MNIFWQDVNHLVTTELIRKVRNVRPERREESEDEAAPGPATVEEWEGTRKDRYRAEDVEGVGEKVRHMNDLQETGC